MTDECDKLDDYLAGGLNQNAEAEFVRHIEECEVCREAVDQQRWIDGLLQSSLALEPAPDAIVNALLATPVRQSLLTRRIVAAVMATAAAILVATGWVWLNRQAEDGTNSVAISGPANGEQVNAGRNETAATFVSDSNAIAVPVESRHHGVTIVRVYPTFQPRVDPQTLALQPTASTADANDIWSDYSNGG